MLESFLRPGKQDAPAATVSAQPATNGTGATVGGKVATNGAGEKGAQALEWGVSITDACIGWEETLELLSSLNEVRSTVFLCTIFDHPSHTFSIGSRAAPKGPPEPSAAF